MRFYLANTDYDWYRYLSRQPDLDEANFWRPGGSQVVKYLKFGDAFVFKLKKAHGHAIVGFGFFVAFARMSVGQAWETFGVKNGAQSLDEMWRRVVRYIRGSVNRPYDPRHHIGCDLVASPVFFPEEMWVRAPEGWQDQIVTGAGIDADSGDGLRIWRQCLERAAALGPALPVVGEVGEQTVLFEDGARYGNEQLIRPRLGQGTFRYALERVYGRCAVTGEHALPALDAAHIVSYRQGGRHEISNGLLLRADIHRLFDQGYVTVMPDYHFRVSPRLEHDFHNGKVYYGLENTQLWVPENQLDKPRPDYLEQHNDEVFLAT